MAPCSPVDKCPEDTRTASEMFPSHMWAECSVVSSLFQHDHFGSGSGMSHLWRDVQASLRELVVSWVPSGTSDPSSDHLMVQLALGLGLMWPECVTILFSMTLTKHPWEYHHIPQELPSTLCKCGYRSLCTHSYGDHTAT